MTEDLRALASATGMAVVSLDGLTPTELALHLVPDWLARRHQIVPMTVEGHVLTYATSRAVDAEVDTDISYTSGRRTHAVLAPRAQIVAALDRCYGPCDGAAQPTAPPADTETRRRVLVTDDEPTTRMLVRRLLEREGFEVIEAISGMDGIIRVNSGRPDVVLMDLNMPGMDGYEAIRRLRAQMASAQLPILVLTAEEGPDVQRRVLALGADDYIVKPFHSADLVARVRGVLQRTAALAA